MKTFSDFPLCPEGAFHSMIDRELTRTSRSGRPLLLVLFDISGCAPAETAGKVASMLSSSTREIDAKGWYADGAVLGVLCTEFGAINSADAAGEAIVNRLYGTLSALSEDRTVQIMAYTMPAGFAAREALPPPWMHDRGRKRRAT